MTDRTSTSTIFGAIPQLHVKELVIVTPSTFATSDTIDVSTSNPKLKTILSLYICDGTGVVKTATFSGTTITAGTITTGVHTIRVLGHDLG